MDEQNAAAEKRAQALKDDRDGIYIVGLGSYLPGDPIDNERITVKRSVKMKAFIACILLSVCLAAGPAAAGAEDAPISAQAMVVAMDNVRNPGKPFRLSNRMVEYVGGTARGSMTLMVFSRLNEATRQYDSLVRYQAPPRDVGKVVLMEGSKMYFYDPESKASVRLSPQQRLLGQASNADVVTVNFANDYTANLVGDEAIQDSDHISRDCWHLDLKAANNNAMYSHVEFWVEKGDYKLIKGKYYSDSGRLMKISYFGNYYNYLDNTRPNRVIIIDAIDPKQVTTMEYSDWRFQDIPDSWFQRDFMPRLPVE